MQFSRRLRFCGASLVAATAVASACLCGPLSACSDDPQGAETTDAGLIDTSPGDSAKDVRSPSAATPRLTVVNATHDMGPSSSVAGNAAIRLCFKYGSVAQNLSVAPYPPLPYAPAANSPSGLRGLAYGSGASLPTVGLDFSGRIIVPIVVSAKSLAAHGLDDLGPYGRAPTCDEVVGDAADAAAGLSENRDYWVLPQIDPGSLANDQAYILALTGCVGDAVTVNPGKCGVGFVAGGGPGLGNLKLTIYETDGRAGSVDPVPANALGAQFLYLSTQANAFFSQAAAKDLIEPGFVRSGVDGGGFRRVAEAHPPIGSFYEILVQVKDVTAGDSFAFGPKSLSPSEAALGMPLLPSSLVAIHRYSGLSTSSAPYPNGQGYVFIAVGDPDTSETKPFVKPDGTPGGDGGDGSRFNTRFFHFLAYPSSGRGEAIADP